MKVQSIYSSRILKKSFEFAAENGALFASSAALAFSLIRPLVILSTPNTDKENKYYASTKSIVSSAIGYMLMLGVSLPVSRAVKNIDNNPEKYLKDKTKKLLMAGEKSLKDSKKYSFATQLFKLGLGCVIAAPKSILTCACIPPIMNKLFLPNNENDSRKSSHINFTGIYKSGVDKMSKIFGRIMDSDAVLKLSERFHNTRFEQHIISFTDVLSTAVFMHQTAKSSQIKENRKKPLIYNAAISTGLSVAGGYLIDGLTKKPTEKFIEKFKEVNKNSEKLATYVEGIRVVKPVLILGSIYYIIIPLISTFFSDKFSKIDKNV